MSLVPQITSEHQYHRRMTELARSEILWLLKGPERRRFLSFFFFRRRGLLCFLFFGGVD